MDLPDWRELYEIAARVKTLAPWTFMRETDVFGIDRTDQGGTMFVSVMGSLGEHLAVSIYPDVAAISAYWRLFKDDNAGADDLLEIPQLQLSFENREYLERADLQVIKQLGLKFKGPNAWPRFRSIRPGYAPWFVDESEAPMLRVGLEQLLEVAPRIKSDPSLVQLPEPRYLVRSEVPDGGQRRWADDFRDVAEVIAVVPRFLPDADTVKKCHQLPKAENRIQLDFRRTPMRVGEAKERPRFAYCLLGVDSQSGLIVGQQLFAVETSIGDMLRSVPQTLIEWFQGGGARPSQLVVRQGRAADMFRPTCEALGIELRAARSLPQLDPALQSLFDFVMRR